MLITLAGAGLVKLPSRIVLPLVSVTEISEISVGLMPGGRSALVRVTTGKLVHIPVGKLVSVQLVQEPQLVHPPKLQGIHPPPSPPLPKQSCWSPPPPP